MLRTSHIVPIQESVTLATTPVLERHREGKGLISYVKLLGMTRGLQK